MNRRLDQIAWQTIHAKPKRDLTEARGSRPLDYVPHWDVIINHSAETATDQESKLLYVICFRAKRRLHLSTHGLDADDYWLLFNVTLLAKQRCIGEERSVQLLRAMRTVDVPEDMEHRLNTLHCFEEFGAS
jgi:hypothetical protein